MNLHLIWGQRGLAVVRDEDSEQAAVEGLPTKRLRDLYDKLETMAEHVSDLRDEIFEQLPTVECERCHGSGEDWTSNIASDVRCGWCDGRGRVLAKVDA